MAERTIVTLGDTLAALVEGKKYTTLRDILVTMNAVDVAAVFEDMPQDKLPLLFRLLPKELAAETFVEMAPEAQELLIQGFSDNELKEVVDELNSMTNSTWTTRWTSWKRCPPMWSSASSSRQTRRCAR